MANTRQNSKKNWNTALLINAVILSQLPFALASSDPPESDNSKLHNTSDEVRPRIRPWRESPETLTGSPAPAREAAAERQAAPPNNVELAAFHEIPLYTNSAEDGVSTGQQTRQYSLSERGYLNRRRARRSHQTPMSSCHRKLVLIVFSFLTLFCGAIFLGFKAIVGMMVSDNAYATSCPPNESSNDTISLAPPSSQALLNSSATNASAQISLTPTSLFLCPAQDALIQGVYSMAYAVCCFMSLCAGLLLDNAGARATAAIGSVMHIAGLMLFAFRRYALGLSLVAGGQQIDFLAALSLTRLFPSNRASVLGLLGALASTSAVVPVILRAIMQRLNLSLRQVILGYTLIIGLPALLLGACMLPSRDRPAGAEERHESIALRGVGMDERLRAEAPGELRARTGALRFQSIRRILRRLINILMDRTLWRNVFSLPFLLISVIFSVASVTTSYYIQAAERVFFGTAGSQVDFFCPFAGLPCALLGLVSDHYGSAVAMLALTVAGMLMISSSFAASPVAGYISLLALVMYMSALTAQAQWFSMEAFPSSQFGTISGIVFVLGGAASLIANWLYGSVTMEWLQGDTFWVQAALGIAQLLQLVWIFLASWALQRRRGHRGNIFARFRRHLRREVSTPPPHPRIRELTDD